ncbi:MAG: hypothetical protein Q7R30_10100 [Acidobacteriota bacterium]|nr:hypothetical protein [Acidobacteriota bacterium]
MSLATATADPGTEPPPSPAGYGETSRAGVPWYLWCSALAVTSAYVGGYWDISWHRSIGRDSFWSAPHMAIYACGILAGISSGYLIFTTTFGRKAPLKDVSVRIWGLSGPLGAFIAAWGGVAMLSSAPFDDWWHNAYGLDVRIISPPHMVLTAGFFGIQLGTVMLLAAFMNRAQARLRPALERLFLYVGGTVLCESLLIKLESISKSDQHNARFFIAVAIGTPAILAALTIASERRWASTIMAGIYSAFALAFLWILPLFPASPKLGPVHQQVTHFIPWEFPLLIIVPAFVTDLILQRTGGWRPIVRALVAGLAFLAVFVAVQWPFATFMLTPSARNWFFGSGYVDFSTPARSALARNVFVYREADAAQFWRGMLIAAVVSCFMMWIGLHAGRAMRKVRR